MLIVYDILYYYSIISFTLVKKNDKNYSTYLKEVYNNLGEIKDYIWPIPIIGGIFSIISILCPAAYFNYSDPHDLFLMRQIGLWMWNLICISYNLSSYIFQDWHFGGSISYYGSPGGVYLDFSGFSLLFGLVFSCIIIISSSLTIFYANQVRIRKIEPSKAIKLWFLLAIIMITSVIGWILTQEFFIQHTSTYDDMPFSFWAHFIPGFGVIGPFIAAALILINILLAKIL